MFINSMENEINEGFKSQKYKIKGSDWFAFLSPFLTPT